MPTQRRRAPPQSEGTPTVLWVLIALNVAVYIGWQLAVRDGVDGPAMTWMAEHFLVSSTSVGAGRVWTLLTTAFSHITPTHLFVNLLALWVFGRDVHQVAGNLGFAHLYVAGALAASVGHVAVSVATGNATPALGASGSVMAIAVVYAALFPKRILLLGFFIPVPAAIAVLLYIVADVAGLFGGARTGIAHAAHLGGAFYGFFYWLFWLRPRLRPRPR